MGNPINQNPTRLTSIGASVSPTPLSTPDPTACNPSKIWKIPATGMSVVASLTTSRSGV